MSSGTFPSNGNSSFSYTYRPRGGCIGPLLTLGLLLASAAGVITGTTGCASSLREHAKARAVRAADSPPAADFYVAASQKGGRLSLIEVVDDCHLSDKEVRRRAKVMGLGEPIPATVVGSVRYGGIVQANVGEHAFVMPTGRFEGVVFSCP